LTKVIDRGTGPAVVLVPGIQGRWEWMRSTVDALASRCRVVTYSLCDEPTSGDPCLPELGFENFMRQIETVLDRARLDRAVIAGVSFGGLIAAEFAARHPERVSGLVLASALPPTWVPNRRERFYMRAPLLGSPAFVLTAPARLLPEVFAARPTMEGMAAFVVSHTRNIVRAPTRPRRMARRAQWAVDHRFGSLGHVEAPALVITGEDHLDRVVHPSVTREFVRLLPRAEAVVLPRTGHLGLVTAPDRFAALIADFVHEKVDRDAAVESRATGNGKGARR
jgi:pimeloyl-ACP methyl ester carboxylesterase